MRRNSRTGFTLIECMIAIAIVGILAAAAASTYRNLSAPGTPGHTSLRIDQARELLVEAHETIRATPFDELTDGVTEAASRLAGMTLVTTISPLSESACRIEIVAEWSSRGQEQRLLMVALRGGTP